MYCSLIYLNVPFIYVFLSWSLYSAKGISAMDTLPVICLGSDVALNKSKFIIIITKQCFIDTWIVLILQNLQGMLFGGLQWLKEPF